MELRLLRQITLVLSLLGLVCVPVAAQERPWGRMDNPVTTPGSSAKQSGYLGRYNPWANKREEGQLEGDEQPRYRESQPRSESRYRAAPPDNPWDYPKRYDYTYPSPYGYGMPYNAPYPGGLPGLAPWFGGINPDYGNYWNDPYDTLSPDTGMLWSDMWRW